MTTAKTAEKTSKNHVEDLLKVGAHFGFVKSRRHPSAMPFILGKKNNIEIFDLEKTSKKLEEAKEFVKKLASEKKTIIFVGGKRESISAIKLGAEKIEMPYVAGRWIGGTLTNFDEIKKRVKKLVDLTDEKEKGLLAKYTKKERLLIDKEIEKLTERFSGLIGMDKKPSAMFVIDSDKEKIARDETTKENIPVISVCGSDCDLTKVSYPIPANDTSIHSIKYFVDQIVEAYSEGVKIVKS